MNKAWASLNKALGRASQEPTDLEVRDQTSHAYDEHKAQMIFQALPDFLKSAQSLLQQFEQRIKPT